MCEGENNLDALRWIYILGQNDFPASYMAISLSVLYDLCWVCFFSFFPPFKTQGCPCETVPSPGNPLSKTKGSQKIQRPGWASQDHLIGPIQLQISPSPHQLSSAESTAASPGAGFRLQTPAQMKREAPLRISGKAHHFVFAFPHQTFRTMRLFAN